MKKQVVILDNGEEWSDHAIEFVVCGKFTVTEVERLWSLVRSGGGCWTVVAVGQDFDWRDPKALTQVHEAIFPQSLVSREGTGIKPSAQLPDLGVPLVRKLVAAWYRHPPDGWEPGTCVKMIEKWLKSQGSGKK